MQRYVKGVITDTAITVGGLTPLVYKEYFDFLGSVFGYLTVLLGFIVAAHRTYKYFTTTKKEDNV